MNNHQPDLKYLKSVLVAVALLALGLCVGVLLGFLLGKATP